MFTNCCQIFKSYIKNLKTIEKLHFIQKIKILSTKQEVVRCKKISSNGNGGAKPKDVPGSNFAFEKITCFIALEKKEYGAPWLPNINEFFFSLRRLINTCDSQLHSVSRDRSEFLTRRLDEYARTMSIIVTRFNESYGHLESQRSCLHNLSYILDRMLSLRSHFEREFLLQD